MSVVAVSGVTVDAALVAHVAQTADAGGLSCGSDQIALTWMSAGHLSVNK
jgi:hypothetical protein